MKILNASEPGLGSSMTEDEVRDFLSNSMLFARLGTIDEKGDPNVHPVWYYFDNGRIYFETGKNSKKVRNIMKRNNIYFCIDETNTPYKGVRGKGTAIISEDISRNVPIAEKIMIKYTGSIDNNMAKFLMDSIKRGESTIIEIIPTSIRLGITARGQYKKTSFLLKMLFIEIHSFKISPIFFI